MDKFQNSAKNFAQNAYFYLLENVPSSNRFNWYTLMTFYNSSQFIMNKITFDKTGQALENYNLHGYEGSFHKLCLSELKANLKSHNLHLLTIMIRSV